MPKPKKQKKSQAQWMFLAPEDVLKDGADNGISPTFVKLRHPRTDDAAQFLICGGGSSVLEVMRFNEEPRSWLIEDSVQEDGSLFISTKVDPLFIVIPYLQKCSTKFMPIDQILTDEKYPQISKLNHSLDTELLSKISDHKEVNGLNFVRINEEQVLDWLRKKVERTTNKLLSSDIKVTSGSQSATFVRSKKSSDGTRDDYLRYAFGLVSDYISTDLSSKLHDFMGIPEKPKEPVCAEEPPSKKPKLSPNSAPDEDYMKSNNDGAVKPKASQKLTLAQKQLAKVDKKGMKTISSFFSGKTKKK